jgi:chromosome segregation ATPase
MVNSLAYCAQAVLEQAQLMAGTVPAAAAREAAPPFELEDLRRFLTECAAELRSTGDAAYHEIAASIEQFAANVADYYGDLEDLELRLTALEDKMAAIARSRQTEEESLAARRALAGELRPYRGKMSAAQLSMLEQQYLARRLLDAAGLPRLSLFYLR